MVVDRWLLISDEEAAMRITRDQKVRELNGESHILRDDCPQEVPWLCGA